MNIILFEQSDRCTDGQASDLYQASSVFDISICGDRFERLMALRGRQRNGVVSGQLIRVGEIGGRVGQGEVISVEAGQARIRVSLQDAPIAKLPVTLIMALPRPKMLRRILRMVSELGVAQLRLINTQRVEKSYWQSPVLKPEVIREYLVSGLTQTGDTILPQVTLHRSFKQFVETQLGEIVSDRAFLVAHPGDFRPFHQAIQGPLCLAIGPEGGFTAAELDQFAAYRAQRVSLGHRVLRVETAIAVALAQCMMAV